MGHTAGKIILDLVRVAPTPLLAWLDGTNHRVSAGVEMLCSVLILGRIATTHVTTVETNPQMKPPVTGLDTVLAYMPSGL